MKKILDWLIYGFLLIQFKEMKKILDWLIYGFLLILSSIFTLGAIMFLFAAITAIIYGIIAVFITKSWAIEYLDFINGTVVWAFQEYPQAFSWTAFLITIPIFNRIYKHYKNRF